MVDRAAHFLGRRITALFRDIVAVAIMARDRAVIDGQILVAAIEIAHGIAARFHHRAEQTVAAQHRFLRAVDEQRLDLAPFALEPIAFGRAQGADVEFGDALLALFEIAFRAAAPARAIDRAIVFVAELVAQMIGLATTQDEPDDGEHGNHDRDHHEQLNEFGFLHNASPLARSSRLYRGSLRYLRAMLVERSAR